jgi:phage baseplate assembly protein W
MIGKPVITSIYSDLNEFDPLNQGPISRDVQAIYQSIFNIINTKIGERMLNPDFGVNLETLLFKPMVPITATQIKREITSAIKRWEDRVTLSVKQTTVTSDTANKRYNLTIAFLVKGIDNQVFQYKGTLPTRNPA